MDRRSHDKPFRKGKSRTAQATAKRPVHLSGRVEKDKKDEVLIRLNKYISNSGLCSRREADGHIAAGLVTVNGKVVKELGTKVHRGDMVTFAGERIKPEKPVYVLLNKPKDYITSLRDPKHRKTVFDLVRHACRERIYPVGRLDRNTTGLLLFTNDGDLSKKLTHPSHRVAKIYHVELDRKLKPGDLAQLSQGLTLEDGFIRPDAISYDEPADHSQVGIEIHSGRNRIVRRMFEHLQYHVEKLDRVYYAGLTKKGLPRGSWRFLTDSEIHKLKMSIFS